MSRDSTLIVRLNSQLVIHSNPEFLFATQVAPWFGWTHAPAGIESDPIRHLQNGTRSPSDILAELRSMPQLPETCCFTHGDACLPNFLTHGSELTGIIDVGRAGVTHPAQDWALAIRSVRANFGSAGERLLRQHLPPHSQDEELLRRFRLLDELF